MGQMGGVGFFEMNDSNGFTERGRHADFECTIRRLHDRAGAQQKKEVALDQVVANLRLPFTPCWNGVGTDKNV